MVLTPHDTWHNHGNQGDDPAINLSVLDLPLGRDPQRHVFRARLHRGQRKASGCASADAVRALPVRLLAAGLRRRRPAAALRLAHARHRQRLADVCLSLGHDARGCWRSSATGTAIPTKRCMVEYVDPTNGRPVFKTITFFMQMLRPGERTLPLKQNASLLVRAVRGQRPQPDRRQAAGLGAVRHLRRAGRRPGASTSTTPTASRRSCSSPATSRP